MSELNIRIQSIETANLIPKMTILNKNIEKACIEINERWREGSRFIFAIAGPPCAGKSTFAQAVSDKINDSVSNDIKATVIPMDGFHLDNRILKSRNLLARKGAPETFDSAGFCALIHRLKNINEEIFYPTFDRSLDLAIANAGVVLKDTSVIIIEGNYLLLDTDPWNSLHSIYDYTLFLSPPIKELEKRLLRRWIDYGLDESTAQDKVWNNDLPNARLILENSIYR